MATQDDTKDAELDSGAADDETVDAQFAPAGEALATSAEEGGDASGDSSDPDDEGDDQGGEDKGLAQLGATKYVHAAFFAAGILVAFLAGKLLGVAWNSLAAWPTAVRSVPQLLHYAEDERGNITMVAGAVIGVVTVVQIYRKEAIRAWAEEVASELGKCSWPNRETVTNGTIICAVAALIATTYVALLDRLWGFLTMLVYGA